MRLIFVAAIVMVLGCGCGTPKSVDSISKAPVIQAKQMTIGASREAVDKAKLEWQKDSKNAEKRKAYDDAVSACMAVTGKAK